MKDSGYFSQIQFSFPLSEEIKGLICSFGLVCRYNTLCKPGVCSPLRPQKLLHFKLLNMHSPTFPDTFSSSNVTYIYVGMLQNIYFNVKDIKYLLILKTFLCSNVCKNTLLQSLQTRKVMA